MSKYGQLILKYVHCNGLSNFVTLSSVYKKVACHFLAVTHSSLDLQETPPCLEGRCTSSLGWGKMYILPWDISREDVHPPSGKMYILPSRRHVHPPSTKGGCTFSLRWGRMYILPRRGDVHPPLAGACNSSLSEGSMYILPLDFWREHVHPPCAEGGCTSSREGRMRINPKSKGESIMVTPHPNCFNSKTCEYSYSLATVDF